MSSEIKEEGVRGQESGVSEEEASSEISEAGARDQGPGASDELAVQILPEGHQANVLTDPPPQFPLRAEVMRHGKRRIVIGHCLEQSLRGDNGETETHWVYLVHNPDKGSFNRLTAEAAEEDELESVVAHAARLLGVTE